MSARTKNLGLRVPPNFPLTTREVWMLVDSVDQLFMEVSNGSVDSYFKYHPEIMRILDKLHEWKEGSQ